MVTVMSVGYKNEHNNNLIWIMNSNMTMATLPILRVTLVVRKSIFIVILCIINCVIYAEAN